LSSGCLLSGAFFNRQGPPQQHVLKPPVVEPFIWPEVDLDKAKKEFAEFDAEVRSLAKQRKFERLEAMARELAESKARFTGGGWKIYSFYACATVMDGNSEEDYKKEFEFLRAWKKAIPLSITASSLIAGLQVQYAWKARGEQYASQVNEDSWQIFQSRIEKAEEEIQEAKKLEARCHYYFTVQMDLAKAGNKGDDRSRAAFSAAIRFDRDYQYYYGNHAISLMPRWGGNPGDWERFAEETKMNIGGQRGLQMYFYIVADVSDLGFKKFFSENHPSWKDTKEGYRSIVEEFGTTPLHLNRFAKLASEAQDNQAYCTAVERIRNEKDFVQSVWRGVIPTYELVKTIAADRCKSGPSWSMAE
jgi:hypothetical protein